MKTNRIKIDKIGKISSIFKFSMNARANEHASCEIEVEMLDYSGIYSCIQSAETVEIVDGESGTTIFRGIIVNVIEQENSVLISMKSKDILQDVKKQKRVFQKTGIKYSDIFEYIGGQDEVSYVCGKEMDSQTQNPIYQYGETNWQLAVRLASEVGTYAFPMYRDTVGDVLIGTDLSDSTSKDDCEYVGNVNTLKQELLNIKTKKQFNLGSKLSVDGVEYTVLNEKIMSESEILIFEYDLLLEAMSEVEKIENEDLSGLVLFAGTSTVETDSVKVKFELDDKYTGENSYSWETTTGNLLYCMPEVGTRLMVQIDDETGAKAQAVLCMPTSSGDKIPVNKTFTVPNGSSFQMTPEVWTMQTSTPAKPQNSILIDEGRSLMFNTTGNILLNNMISNVSIQAKYVAIYALDNIHVTKPSAAELLLNGIVEIDGIQVNVEAVTRIDYDPIQDAPTEIVIDGKKWLKLGLKVLAAVAVVALACVVAVALAPAAAALASAALCMAVPTMATGTIVASVVGLCVCGGAAFAFASVHEQMKKDNGVKRRWTDYLYMAVDSFCTGAIMTAPLAVFTPFDGIEMPFLYSASIFGSQMAGAALMSLYYQKVDSTLDNWFGGDFYDEDSNVGLNVLFDTLCNGFGIILGNAAMKIYQSVAISIAQKVCPRLLITSRTAARQYLREHIGVNEMSKYRDLLLKNYVVKNMIRKYVEKYGGTFNNTVFAEIIDSFFLKIDKNTEKYKKKEKEQYFYFDSQGQLVWN